MDRHQLHRELDRLHQELEDVDNLDPEGRDKLRKIQADIRDLLDHERPAERYGDLGNQLRDSVYHFDASHPVLARRLAQVIDSLALFNL